MTSYYQQPAYLAPETRARSVDINTLNDAAKAAFDAIPASDQTWTGVHDFRSGTVRVKSPIGPNDAAPRGYVDAVLTAGGKFPLPPAQGNYEFTSSNGNVGWAVSSAFSNSSKLAESHALALSFL